MSINVNIPQFGDQYEPEKLRRLAQEIERLAFEASSGETTATSGTGDTFEGLDDTLFAGLAEGDLAFYDLSQAKWVNRQLAAADITQSMVTQHEDALTIAYSQLTGAPSSLPPDAHTHTESEITDLQNYLLATSDPTITGSWTWQENILLENNYRLRGESSAGAPYNLIGITVGDGVAVGSSSLPMTIAGSALTIGPDTNVIGALSEGGVLVVTEDRSVSTDDGLEGGGDLSADRTIGLAFDTLPLDTPLAADEFAFYDAVGGVHKAIAWSDLEAQIDHANIQNITDPDAHEQYVHKTGMVYATSGNNPEVTLSYDPATRIVTITPIGSTFDVWVQGNKFTKTGAQTSSAHADVSDEYFIYYDVTGDLQVATTPWDLKLDAPIASITYTKGTDTSGGTTAEAPFALDELHSSTRDPELHYRLHFGGGTKLSSLPGPPTISIAASPTFTATSVTVLDEDIERSTGTIDNTFNRVTWRYGTGGYYEEQLDTFGGGDGVPFLNDGTDICYNEYTGATWQKTAVANNNYVNMYLCATTDIDVAKRYFIVPGQTTYADLNDAENADPDSAISWGDVAPEEFVIVASFTYQRKTSYGAANLYADIISYKLFTGDRQSVTGAGGTTDHGALSGLGDDDHPQYAGIAQAETITAAWNFAPTAGGDVGLTLTENAAQTSNIMEVYDAGGILRQFIYPGGFSANYSGYHEFARRLADANDFISTYYINEKGALDEKVWIWEGDASEGTWRLRHCDDSYANFRNDMEFRRDAGEVDLVTFGNHDAAAPQYGFNANGASAFRGDAAFDEVGSGPYGGQSVVFDVGTTYCGGGVYSDSVASASGYAWWEISVAGKTTSSSADNATIIVGHLRGGQLTSKLPSVAADELGVILSYGRATNNAACAVYNLVGIVDAVNASKLEGGLDIRTADGTTSAGLTSNLTSRMRFKGSGEIVTGTGTYFTGDNEFVGLRLSDSGLTDFMDLSHNGTSVLAGFTNTATFSFLDGVEARVYDSGNTDYIGLEHNGTDGRITTTDNISIGVDGSGDVEMRYANTVQTRTQDGSATGNNSGLLVRHQNNSFYNVGFMEEPWLVVNSALASTQAAWEVYVGQTIYSNNSTAYTYTLPPSTNTFPNGTWWNITNTGTANITITPGSGTTLLLMDGSASTGSRTLAPKGFCRVYRRNSSTYYMIHFGGVT